MIEADNLYPFTDELKAACRPQPSAKAPDENDVLAGSRLRTARLLKGMSQSDLGNALGVTFQQVQKYEKGANRISASKLAAAAEALGVTPGFFFGEEDVLPKIYDEISKLIGMLDSSEAFELNSHFVKIRDPKVRGKVISLFKAIAAQEGVETD